MATVDSTKQYTPEDLLHMPDGDRYELVDGQLVERNMSAWSSYVAGLLFALLFTFCRSRRLGWVFPDGTSYQCFADAPSKVRKPDVSFIELARMTVQQSQSEGHISIFPDLAVEVISPNDLAYDIDTKVQEYRTAGTRLVWIVHPQARRIDVFRFHGAPSILTENDDLDGEDVLPGFRCRGAELFQPPA